MRESQRLLRSYVVDVEEPDVSGIEHHHMLRVRDRLQELELELSAQEREELLEADRQLAAQAPAFVAALSRFVDLAEERRRRPVDPSRWWWYLDVLAKVPRSELVAA